MIRVENISKNFGGVTVLKNVSCHIRPGERVALIGPSGAGKSVFLRCLNGLERPDSGEIFIGPDRITGNGEERRRARARTGMVFQQFNLFTHLNVLDNIALAPITVLKKKPSQAFEYARELLELVGLPDKRMAYPSELSGGQMQRIGIARALAMDPDILLFDEPTSALDPSMAGEVLSVIAKLKQRGKLLVIITHELQFVRDIAERVIYIDEQGIYEEGTPAELLANPKREKTLKFLESIRA